MPETAKDMTYSSLVQDIKAYLERGDTADETVLRQIPIIIGNSQRSLADKLKIQGYIDVLRSTMQVGASGAVIAKPDGWRNTVSINIGTGADFETRRTLRLRSYDYLRAIFSDPNTVGEPEFYADYNQTHWIVGPSPAREFPYEANVYRLPPLLDETNQQNYLTRYCPFLLLYECLTAMEPFLRNDSRMALWAGLRDEQIKNINAEDLQKVADRSIEREHA